MDIITTVFIGLILFWPFLIFLAFIYAIYLSISRIKIRSKEEKKLKVYLQNHQVKLQLINRFCEMRFVDNMFYCKERTHDNKIGRYFEVSGNKEHAMTMWAFMNMTFSASSTFHDIRRYYLSIGFSDYQNTGEESIYLDDNDMIRWDTRNNRFNNTRYRTNYFFETRGQEYPIILNEAQNEFCRMTLENENGHFYLTLKEIWGYRNFIIECDYPEKELIKFRTMNSKMLQYNDLLKYYKFTRGLKVIIPDENKKNNENVQQSPELKTYTNQQEENTKIQNSETTRKENNTLPERNDEREVDL